LVKFVKLEKLARLGYASIGVVYLVVGGLAAMAGLGRGGAAADQNHAAAFILGQPFGRPILALMAAGLAGYILWRLVSGVIDSEGNGGDARGMAARVGSIFRGLVYAGFLVELIRLVARGGSGRDGDEQADHLAARILDAPFGGIAMAAAGLAVVGYGAYQVYAAWESQLGDKLRLGTLDARVRGKVVGVSRFGIAARGVVFVIIGGSLVVAATRGNPSEVHGTSGALGVLPPPLLVLIGFGLAAYGVYALVNARYRQIAT
jgi:hypothetical protein